MSSALDPSAVMQGELNERTRVARLLVLSFVVGIEPELILSLDSCAPLSDYAQ